MSTSLNGKVIAFLVAPDGVEQVGGTAGLVSTEVGKIQAFNHLTPADTFEADTVADSVSASHYPALALPGGVGNPDFLRTNDAAVAFAKSFSDAGKPIAVICHGPWTLIEAYAVRGSTIKSWPSVQTDCAMRVRIGSTTRWSNGRAGQTRWCRAASPTTFARSATRWWKRSAGMS